MSRTSRIPYHQNVYDLLQLEPRPLAGITDAIRDWESRVGNKFPPSMAEFYTTEGVIRCGANLEKEWVLSLVDLWSEFSNSEQAHSLDELFGQNNRPEQEWRPPRGYNPDQYPDPFFRLIMENQGNWTLYALANGSNDPPVFTTDGELGPWNAWCLAVPGREAGWQAIGPFTEVLFEWFASYYLEADFVPSSFINQATFTLWPDAPPKPYRNRLWLRTPAEPFEPAVIDHLIDQFGEPERTPRPGNVTTYTFRPNGGIIRVTADEPTHGGGLSAWWVHADSPERLAELGRLIVPFGTLRDTLRADTDPAREVLKLICGDRV